MGEGECAGEMTRGLLGGAGSDEAWAGLGAACWGSGEAFMAPKLICGRPPFALTGPPFGIVPLAPDALMTTEGLRP
jgi:hypothetical protein